jgi:hypothetical protein
VNQGKPGKKGEKLISVDIYATTLKIPTKYPGETSEISGSNSKM